jgi:magnesium chelatase family protein
MVAIVSTVAYLGLEARAVEVQVQLIPGQATFTVVGLADKAVGESRERVRGALSAIGLSIPPKRIVVNLSPADLPKEGSHFDLPIALALLAAIGVADAETLSHYVIVGELGLDGRITASPGVLLAALHASAKGKGLICPAAQGSEAAWAGDVEVLAANSLLDLLAHLRGASLLPAPVPGEVEPPGRGPDLAQVKGQETAKRALEIAAAGAHNLLMVGPPGAGKSLLAACLPGILPPLGPSEALEASMIASVAGELSGGRLVRTRPFRAPHHSASMPALVGGGLKVRPGEISLAHLGVLFLDELPEFQRAVLDSLRQPLETGTVCVARPADRGDEPMPLRPPRRPGPRLQPRAALRRRLPSAGIGADARPDRPPRRCPGGERGGPHPAAARRGKRGGRGAGRGCARSADGAVRRPRDSHQCRGRWRIARGRCHP